MYSLNDWMGKTNRFPCSKFISLMRRQLKSGATLPLIYSSPSHHSEQTLMENILCEKYAKLVLIIYMEGSFLYPDPWLNKWKPLFLPSHSCRHLYKPSNNHKMKKKKKKRISTKKPYARYKLWWKLKVESSHHIIEPMDEKIRCDYRHYFSLIQQDEYIYFLIRYKQ